MNGTARMRAPAKQRPTPNPKGYSGGILARYWGNFQFRSPTKPNLPHCHSSLDPTSHDVEYSGGGGLSCLHQDPTITIRDSGLLIIRLSATDLGLTR